MKPEIRRISEQLGRSTNPGRHRLKAVCVIRDGKDYLFAEGRDPEPFLIPVGGGIEFMEPAAAAAVREVREEAGVDITDPQLMGVLEQIFSSNGGNYHEVVFCFIARTPERSLVPSEGRESNGASFPLIWLSLEELKSHNLRIFPDGLLGLLAEHGNADYPARLNSKP